MNARIRTEIDLNESEIDRIWYKCVNGFFRKQIWVDVRSIQGWACAEIITERLAVSQRNQINYLKQKNKK